MSPNNNMVETNKRVAAKNARDRIVLAMALRGEVEFDDLLILSKANTLLRQWENE